MKRLLAIALLMISAGAHAQDFHTHRIHMTENVFRAITILFLIGMIIWFIITFLQRILDFRLRNRIIDKGITETLAASLLTTKPKDDKLSTLKWFCLLAAVGGGLAIVYRTMPLDIHSLSIMAISIAIGYLGYYFVLRGADK